MKTISQPPYLPFFFEYLISLARAVRGLAALVVMINHVRGDSSLAVGGAVALVLKEINSDCILF